MLSAVVPMIHVADVRSTVAWYLSIGFALVDIHEEGGVVDWAMLGVGNTRVMFNAGGRSSEDERREVDLYVYTRDIEDLHRRVKDHVQVREDLHDTFYGHREFVIRDLNGFWVTFGQAPSQSAPSAHAVPPTDP